MILAIDGVDIAYQVWGEGSPLVCLHGGMGLDSAYLNVPAIVGLANAQWQVLLYDQRGHGRSGRSDATRYTHEIWVADLHALAQARQLERFALLGHSYGGFLALEFAVRYPSLLSHLILVGTSAGPVPLGAMPHLSIDPEVEAFFRQQWPRFFCGTELFWDLFEKLTFSAPPFEAAFHRELPNYDLRAQVGRITVPTLLLVGSEDPYLASMTWLSQAMPQANLQILSGTGHMPFLEKPDEFKTRVEDFLNLWS